jgi:hypothetical protein
VRYPDGGGLDAAERVRREMVRLAAAAINGMTDDTNVADYWILEPKSLKSTDLTTSTSPRTSGAWSVPPTR